MYYTLISLILYVIKSLNRFMDKYRLIYKIFIFSSYKTYEIFNYNRDKLILLSIIVKHYSVFYYFMW